MGTAITSSYCPPEPGGRTEAQATPYRFKYLSYLKQCLESSLAVATLCLHGRILDVEGFRLRQLAEEDEVRCHIMAPNDLSLDSLIPTHIGALLELTLPESLDEVLREVKWMVRLPDSRARGGWQVEPNADDDFVFRYPIAHIARPANFAGYVSSLLEILLDVMDFLVDGAAVVPDSVVIASVRYPFQLRSPSDLIAIGQRMDGDRGTGSRQPLHSVIATEPSIVALARHWGLLSSILWQGATEWSQTDKGADGSGDGLSQSPVSDGCSTPVNGFRLRRAADWVVPTESHPSVVYEYLARVCNVSCKFCYLHGNPSGIAVARGSSVVSGSEIDTRLRYYDPKRGLSLFQSQWEINEFLVDPKIHTVLPRLREITTQPFYFITNGNPLSSRTIELLARVRPVHLIVSVNTLDENLRGDMMKERRTQTTTALAALRQLVTHEIPFGVSLAAFPEFPIDDLVRTIRVAEQLPAAFVRVNLPGFTRDLPYAGSFDTDTYWADVTDAIDALRGSVKIPLIIIPSAFEENRHSDPLAARILGVVPGSPAAECGLRPGDEVVDINGFAVETRADMQALLFLGRGDMRITARRAGDRIQLTLKASSRGTYPYDGPIMCKYVFPMGVVSASSLSPRTAAEAERLATELGADRVWLITSPLMKRSGQALLARYAPRLASKARFVVAQSEFLGGNIQIMDMCTVSDIFHSIQHNLHANSHPDLIIMSETGFNSQGRDLEGRHWRDLERWLRVPVRLLPVQRFSF